MPVITISGAPGSGARELVHLVAQRLGIDYVDQQILLDAARRLGVPVEQVAAVDERVQGLRERLAHLLRSFLERSALLGTDPIAGGGGLEMLFSRSYDELTREEEEGQEGVDPALYVNVLSGVVRELAQRGDVVILGRGSHMILKDFPAALHVLTLAPEPVRLQRYALREGVSAEEAARQVQAVERARVLFYKRFWKVDPNDPSYYDLTIVTSRLPLDLAAELIGIAAKAKEEQPA